MAKNETMKYLSAGVFFIVGLCVVGWVIYFIGFQKGFTQPKFQMEVLFDKVGGLTEGAPVRLSGVTVGTVEAIGFLEEEVAGRGLRVMLGIETRYERQVRRSTAVGVQTEGVLGAKYVEISRKSGLLTLDIEQPVMGDPMLDVYDLAVVLQDTAASFNQTTVGINGMMGELKTISRKTKRVLDRIEDRVIQGNLFKLF
jgi:ABC-type transporter Mla subunit MlaD